MGIYEDFYNYMKGKKFYVGSRTKQELGTVWNEMLKEYVGQLVTDRRNGSDVNSIWEEIVGMFPHLFTIELINETDQLLKVFEVYKAARKERKGEVKEKEAVEYYANY